MSRPTRCKNRYRNRCEILLGEAGRHEPDSWAGGLSGIGLVRQSCRRIEAELKLLWPRIVAAAGVGNVKTCWNVACCSVDHSAESLQSMTPNIRGIFRGAIPFALFFGRQGQFLQSLTLSNRIMAILFPKYWFRFLYAIIARRHDN